MERHILNPEKRKARAIRPSKSNGTNHYTTLRLFSKNLLDEEIPTSNTPVTAVTGGVLRGSYLPPRTYGAEVVIDFQFIF